MNLFLVVLILLLVSFAIAFYSVQKELKKPKEIDQTKKELERERVIYHA